MAADQPQADEKLEHSPSSPSIAHSGDLGGSTINDCGTSGGEATSQKHLCGLSILPLYWTRNTSSWGTWRTLFGEREAESAPGVEETITRQREEKPTNCGISPLFDITDFVQLKAVRKDILVWVPSCLVRIVSASIADSVTFMHGCFLAFRTSLHFWREN